MYSALPSLLLLDIRVHTSSVEVLIDLRRSEKECAIDILVVQKSMKH